MRRTVAIRLLILLLSLGVVLSLPGGLLASVGASASGCPHCRMAGQNPGPCSCCPTDGKTGHCNHAGQTSGFNCHCSSGGPAALAPVATGGPAPQVASHVLALVTVVAKAVTPNIFHPPRLTSPA